VSTWSRLLRVWVDRQSAQSVVAAKLREEVDPERRAARGDSAGDFAGHSGRAVCGHRGRERQRQEHAAGPAGRLDSPSEGEIWLDGVPIHNLAEAELAAVRGRKIGFVFQSYQLIQTLTALENVLLPYELNLEGSGLAQARRLLDEVGLKERMDHYPVQLSGGEQQRVALARAFVVEPPIVMADEPTGNLDSANGRLVLDLLLERNRKAGTTLVLVTHDPEVASRADRKIVLRDGLVVEDTLPGPAESIAPGSRKNPSEKKWLSAR
jgi:putative ABC transport system ATP-binding protein